MKLNLKYITISFTVLLIAIACFVHFYLIGVKTVRTLHCNGIHYTHNKNYIIKSNVEMTFDKDKGFMILNGKVTENGVSAHLARKLLFNISDIDNNLVLTFTGVELSIADEVDRANLHVNLPAFMSTVGSSLLISIYRINKYNYIVESNGIASFLCVTDDK
ncbi:hypothetical protein NE897_00260 [Yersinia ruckeri]|uniref:hypothetical protein n=1 Tax=Yersinia ruckeri TaxID=29486 RepID=UPI0004E4692A|nr:hypothetical protein [Yersinia ruckeri]ARZ01101.1 hypothetical protein QMA0440_01764 [Yersinia ruckeri]KFE39092.1 hypothetical protein nADLYRO1b_1279 [Yersinia ruckeri]MCK8539058.1 hypothetical protein [Yersinia ruckeri]MCK8554117.1 hypothetical protein [Yersinia ruckeri]MCK8560522.1 hypothetical protein [Yersinia ruckeri]